MRKLLKQINVIILSFVLIFAPTYVFATTAASEGWSISKRLVQGATTFYDGTKNMVINGKNYAAKGTAAITPAASQVSKMIVRTGAVLAIDLAIKSLIGAVDYVMDPANNRVKYFLVSDPTDPNDPSLQYYYYNAYDGINYATASQACQGMLTHPDYKTFKASLVSQSRCELYRPDGTYFTYYTMYKAANPAYDPNAEPNRQEKYLPYDAVASQVISDAVAEKNDAKAYVSSVADTALEDEQRQIVPATDVINQLNNSQAIPTNNTATGTSTPTTGTGDPSAPPAPPSDITLNFPIFCDWAPTVCVAAQAAIDFPAKVETWIDKIFYKTEGLPQYDTQTDLYIHEQPQIKQVNINWGSVCPAPVTVPLTFMGITRTITVVNYQYICDYAWIIKASVNMVASISAVYIVAGRKE
ncbi:virulence factor TspB C-terminal domain-related protein [Acinetobacter pittii]|uniref:virulence factor TspB C-terminal domain-related protein n=1 Tax=Acinetobacter pittii TaxID=48296 RepID=UPI003978B82B